MQKIEAKKSTCVAIHYNLLTVNHNLFDNMNAESMLAEQLCFSQTNKNIFCRQMMYGDFSM